MTIQMIAKARKVPIFQFSKIVATQAAVECLAAANCKPADLLDRHIYGDFGEINEEDEGSNNKAIKTGERILSVYKLDSGEIIWIITEADRSSTCLLLPEEYWSTEGFNQRFSYSLVRLDEYRRNIANAKESLLNPFYPRHSKHLSITYLTVVSLNLN